MRPEGFSVDPPEPLRYARQPAHAPQDHSRERHDSEDAPAWVRWLFDVDHELHEFIFVSGDAAADLHRWFAR